MVWRHSCEGHSWRKSIGVSRRVVGGGGAGICAELYWWERKGKHIGCDVCTRQLEGSCSGSEWSSHKLIASCSKDAKWDE